MRTVILVALILGGCTSSQSSSLVQTDTDMAQLPAPDMGTDSAVSSPDMLQVIQPDMLQSADLLVAADMLQAADLLVAADMTPLPDLLPPPPDMTGYCHSNALAEFGGADTAVWCSTTPIVASSAAQAQDACQQYNGPVAGQGARTCYLCTAAASSVSLAIAYYGYSNDVASNGNGLPKCSSWVWVYGSTDPNNPVKIGDIGHVATTLHQDGRWAP